MKKIKLIFLLFLAVNFPALSQSNGSSFLDKTDFKVGYSGNLAFVHGLNIGAEYLWKEQQKVKEKKKESKTIIRQFLLNGSLGYSTSFSNQTNNGLATYFGIMRRRVKPNGRFFSLELNPLGYYRSFLPETLEVKGEEVSKVRFPGRSYYAPSFAIGTGKFRSDKRNTGWYLNLNLTIRTSYNALVLPSLTLQYGYRFNFKKK